MRSIIKDKKGDFLGVFIMIILSFIIIMICVMMVYIQNTTQAQLHTTLDNLTGTGIFGATNVSQTIDDTFGDVGLSYDQLSWITVLLIFGMIIGIFIGSYMVTTKPVMFIPYIFLIIIAVIVSVGISNSYETLISDATLGSTFNGFTGANHFMLFLPVYVSIIGFAGGIIMFIRWSRRDEYIYSGGY